MVKEFRDLTVPNILVSLAVAVAVCCVRESQSQEKHHVLTHSQELRNVRNANAPRQTSSQ